MGHTLPFHRLITLQSGIILTQKACDGTQGFPSFLSKEIRFIVLFGGFFVVWDWGGGGMFVFWGFFYRVNVTSNLSLKGWQYLRYAVRQLHYHSGQNSCKQQQQKI